MTVWEKHKQQKVLILSENMTGKFTAPAGLWLLVFFCQMGKAILCGDSRRRLPCGSQGRARDAESKAESLGKGWEGGEMACKG